jgi:predicted acetyltransferase
MSACRLIVPHAGYEASHRSFLEEFAARGERVVPWIVAEPYAAFDAYVAMMEAASRGVGLRDGGVPHSTFWWVATGLLRATLVEARRLGLHRVLLTCDKRNVASAKTILHTGGVLDEEEFMPEYDRVVCRYWIDL